MKRLFTALILFTCFMDLSDTSKNERLFYDAYDDRIWHLEIIPIQPQIPENAQEGIDGWW